MSLLESPIEVHADGGNGPEPMLMIGTELLTAVRNDQPRSLIHYLCVDAVGNIHELTKEWVNVDWRHDGVEWKDPKRVGQEPPPQEEPF